MDLGKSIRVGLAKANKTKSWLSLELHVSPGYVSDMCNGKQVPNTKRIEEIARAFGVPVSEFIKWGE